MATAEVIVARSLIDTQSGGGINYPVRTASGDLYIVYIDAATSDVMFKKSTDGGFIWSAAETVFTGAATQLSIWYDEWSGIPDGYIHMAYTESGGDDTLYRTIDTATDDLSTETTIFAGMSTAATCALSITRARGGNVYCKMMIDAGSEGSFYRLLDADVPNGAWANRTNLEANAASDQWILLPGWAADNQDIMMFFWDSSASEISRCLYDDSGDSWAETSIAGSMTVNVASTSFPHFAAAVDITNSQNLLVAWTVADTLNADLLGWKITESAITALTDVVTNSTDDQGLCAIGIDTDTQDWYVFYAGATGGGETFPSAVNVYYQQSTDDGATWGGETQLTIAPTTISWMACTPRFATERCVAFMGTQGTQSMRMIVDAPTPAAASSGGQRVYGGG
jgi:hypothetical protein